MIVPSILDDICLLPPARGTAHLSKLDFVACGGGPLSSRTGEHLAAAGVKIVNSYGSTETGHLTEVFVPNQDYDWHYFRLRKDLNVEITPVDSEANEIKYHLRMQPFGWQEPFEVQDELVASPIKPSTDFMSIGRSDDLIVLATGEKVHPSAVEAAVSELNDVTAVVAFGSGRFQLGLIVEPTTASLAANKAHFKSMIWPKISELNKQMDGHAQIQSKDLLIMVPPRVRLPRSDKGLVLKKEVYKMFEAEIEEVYAKLDQASSEVSPTQLTLNNLEEELKELVQSLHNWRLSPSEWTSQSDFFELGMDSLQATHLQRLILSAIKNSPDIGGSEDTSSLIDRDFVYRNPSIAKIAEMLRTIGAAESQDLASEESLVHSFINIYAAGPRAVVLLTGSTGSLGTHLLQHLVSLPSVGRVICLSRPHSDDQENDANARLVKSLSANRLSLPAPSWRKVEVLTSTASEPLLGLDEPTYTRLSSTVTHILHNGWPMDFKRALPSFESQFQTLQNLLNLATAASTSRYSSSSSSSSASSLPYTKTRFLFISSIATVGNTHHSSPKSARMIPSTAYPFSSCNPSLGYASAKHICEKIIENFSSSILHQSPCTTSGVEASYIRIGQLSGSTQTGVWNTSEHIPALLRSAQLEDVRALPKVAGTLSWLPVDVAATAVADLLLCEKEEGRGVTYQLENPVRQSWADVIDLLARELSLPVIEYDEWMQRVKKHADVDEADNPAGRLLEFFERDFRRMGTGKVVMDVGEMREVSEAVRRIDGVSQEVVGRYLGFWKGEEWLK
ncbi:MAG: hypothetical protein Q9227_006895 [Pyrenula ochraceoflavens]